LKKKRCRENKALPNDDCREDLDVKQQLRFENRQILIDGA